MHFPPPEGERRDELIRRRRRLRVAVAVLGLLGGALWWMCFVAAPSSSMGGALFDAVLCVSNLVMWIGLARIPRRMSLELSGRAAILLTDGHGLVVVVGPRREKGRWTVTQVKRHRIWNLAAFIAPPTGRGPSFSRALFDLLLSLSPMLRSVPSDQVEPLMAKLEEKFDRDLERLREQARESGVE